MSLPIRKTIFGLCRALTLSASAALFGAAAHAQAYPSKPIRLLAGFAPGSASDSLARLLADRLSAALGQSVVVENRVGALSTLASEGVARAAPDGYTLTLAANSAMSSAPAGMMQVSYDPLKDFTPLGRVATLEFVVVAHTNFSARTLSELIEIGRKPNAKLSCASGNASAMISCATFAKHLGLDLLNVPYKAAPQAVTDLIGGQVPMGFIDVPTAAPQVKAGKLRALGVASASRSALIPDVPTFAEGGVANVPFVRGWTAVYGPAGLPSAVAQKLSDEIAQIVNGRDFAERLAPTGWTPAYMSPNEMDEFLRQDLAFWRAAVNDLGLRQAR